jgi:tRNA pseudouridine38-40 synthase
MDIKADFFLWHMVRKIATALKLIGSSARDVTWLEAMLGPSQFSEALEPAPANGLLLKNVEYKNITWNEDDYAMKLISNNLEKQLLIHSVMAELIRELKENMSEDHASGI